MVGGASRVAVSPDGSRLVYLGEGERNSRLLVRDLDQLYATPLPSTGGADNPFFSPDGSRVGFYSFREDAPRHRYDWSIGCYCC